MTTDSDQIKFNHVWFTIPKGSVVLSPDGKRCILQEDACVFSTSAVICQPEKK